MAKYNMDGGGDAGTATAQPGTDTPVSTPEQQPTGTATAQPITAPEAPQKGDQEVYQTAKDKLSKDRSYKLTPEEAEAVRNVQRGKPRPGPKEEATTTLEPKPAATPEIPAPLKAVMDRLKVEKVEDLPGSVEKLQAEFQRLNGERGNLGPLQEKVTTHARTIENQHAIMRDILQGKPEALDWARKNAQALGLDPASIKGSPAPQAQPQGEAGEFNPDDALDVQTAKYVKGIEAKLQTALDKLEQLGQNTEKYGKFYETELEKQGKAAAYEGATTVVQTLLDTEGVTGVYDKRHGPIRPHLDAFFERGEINEKNKGIVEILKIANERKLDDLGDAYAIWERKNRGSRAVAAARETQADPSVKPTVGLSDRQEGNGGRVNIGPTVEDVIAWKDGHKPMPPEMIKNGKFQKQLIAPDVWAEVERRRGRK